MFYMYCFVLVWASFQTTSVKRTCLLLRYGLTEFGIKVAVCDFFFFFVVKRESNSMIESVKWMPHHTEQNMTTNTESHFLNTKKTL